VNTWPLLARNVIIGQFLGTVLLVVISSFANLLALAIPPFAIGLMGFIPIIIGIKILNDKINAELMVLLSKFY
jgi:cadmium resistance protein CadD (predicted permease)